MKQPKGLIAFVALITIFALPALACGTSDISNLFATETPTPTQTFTPSPTSTPSATPTQTQTPSPTPVPTGVDTTKQADGTTLFTDYDNKYQIALPTGWFVIPLSADDIADILKEMAEENPDLQDSAKAFQQLDPDVIRVIAVSEESKYIYKGFSTNLTITAIREEFLATVPIAFFTGAMESQLESGGATIIHSEEFLITNANGVEIGIVEFKQKALTATGVKIPVQARMLVFQVQGAMINVQLATPQQFAAELLPLLDAVVDSIKLLK
jgi:hypothetical protein